MKTFSVVIFFCLLSLLCGLCHAVTIYQNESQLILTSDQIVYGKIVEVKSAWNTQHTHIETTAQVLVNDTLKKGDSPAGSTETILSISVLGGAVGNDSEWVEDMPLLINETEAIFFLKKGTDGKNSVLRIITETDIAAYKQKISAMLQNKNPSTTIPVTPVPTTNKAGMTTAPLIAILGMVIFLQIRRKLYE
jgi:hypothetical protein